jgi:hypothetical protein
MMGAATMTAVAGTISLLKPKGRPVLMGALFDIWLLRF